MIKRAGIDISKHQGKNIDWAKLKTSDKEFVIIKTGYSWYLGGMNIDSQFLDNAAGATKYGIPWGAYIWAYDKTPAAARISANCLAHLLDADKLDYPVYYDFEDEQYLKFDRVTSADIIKAFLDTIQDRGYYAGLYTYTNFAKGYIDMARLTAYDLWIADYTGKVGWTGPYGMWQHSAKGRLEAVGGGKVDVDFNIAYKDYPSIIRGAGLNGYGERPSGVENCADLREKVETLEREKAVLETKNAALAAKIIAAKAALG